jgi:Fe-Mn family superoxide dismutase
MQYQERKFELPALDGISQKSVEEHLNLYAGYVKNFNEINEAAYALMGDDKNRQAVSELWRRRSFEFDGMRLHEYYFSQFEGGAKTMDPSSAFAAQVKREFPMGGESQPQRLLTNIGSMRSPGWAILYWDNEAGQFQSSFVEQQHQGHLATLPIILALDVWEHAYLLDYGVQGKGKYIEAFFKNLNWSVIEQRFASVAK